MGYSMLRKKIRGWFTLKPTKQGFTELLWLFRKYLMAQHGTADVPLPDNGADKAQNTSVWFKDMEKANKFLKTIVLGEVVGEAGLVVWLNWTEVAKQGYKGFGAYLAGLFLTGTHLFGDKKMWALLMLSYLWALNWCVGYCICYLVTDRIPP